MGKSLRIESIMNCFGKWMEFKLWPCLTRATQWGKTKHMVNRKRLPFHMRRQCAFSNHDKILRGDYYTKKAVFELRTRRRREFILFTLFLARQPWKRQCLCQRKGVRQRMQLLLEQRRQKWLNLASQLSRKFLSSFVWAFKVAARLKIRQSH